MSISIEQQTKAFKYRWLSGCVLSAGIFYWFGFSFLSVVAVFLLLGAVGFFAIQLWCRQQYLSGQLNQSQQLVALQGWLLSQLSSQDFDIAIIERFDDLSEHDGQPMVISNGTFCQLSQKQLLNLIPQWHQHVVDTPLQSYQQQMQQFIEGSQLSVESEYGFEIPLTDGDIEVVNLVELCVVNRDLLVDSKSQLLAVIRFIRRAEIQEPAVLDSQPLVESHKMQALVNLSRGVAHDYNNILGVISGYCELIELELQNNDKLLSYIEKMNAGLGRGQHISEQLFAFSRRKKTGQSIVDFESVVLQPILNFNKKLPQGISFDWLLAHTQLKVKLNRQLMPQVINALGQNAIEAMPQGGSLRFFSSIEVLDEKRAQSLDLSTGQYLCFSVVDNGCGISEQDFPHVLEPYFSTREKMGMGLSLVYGFCQSCEGNVEICSVLGQGTQVNLYFPLLTE